MLAFLAPLSLVLPGNAQALAADADQAVVLVQAHAVPSSSNIAITMPGLGLDALDRDALGFGPLSSDDTAVLANNDDAAAASNPALAIAADDAAIIISGLGLDALDRDALGFGALNSDDPAVLASAEETGAATTPAAAIVDSTAPAASAAAASTERAAASASDVEVLFGGPVVSETDLASANGREGINIMDATTRNVSQIANNTVENSPSGQISVSESAFQNVSGISIISINSGATASINSAMSVNLQINYAQSGQ